MTVQPETLDEAVALAVRAFREHDCTPGPASQIEVEARSPAITRTVSLIKISDWLNSACKSPNEKIMKEPLRDC